MSINNQDVELSIVMPCLNEAETIEVCIIKANKYFSDNNVVGEVVIGDNGSTDGSQAMAEALGARVIAVPNRGYGNALKGGINAAYGKYIIMGDSDDSYDFSKLELYIEKLREGYDLVMGNRFKGGVMPGAMPFLHKYLGNPVLSFIGRLFFGGGIGDFHCGLRGFSKEAYIKMDLQTTGMEFASEMVVKSTIKKLKIAEVPTILHPDGRSRPPHLRTWRDGWRHLRFLMMYAPAWVFFYPSITLILIGTILGGLITNQPLEIRGVTLDVDTLMYMALLVFVGVQGITFYMIAKIFAINEGLLPYSKRMARYSNWFTFEKGLVISLILILAGLVGSISAINHWRSVNFGDLETGFSMRIIVPSILAILVGVQLFFTNFVMGILGLKKKSNS
ncbi:MAG: glycosyltransferase family 2 protein [Bacteroidota bacterium]|nr:glycosyltransferase family 2 protein [Bacteroidota bacterium]